MTVRGSDLTLLKNQIYSLVNQIGSPNQKEYFNLVFKEQVNLKEVSKAYGLCDESIYSTLVQLRNKIKKEKPFVVSREALKYKGAARILKMLAIQCDRKNEAHSDAEYSYTKLFKSVCEISENEATDIQKCIYDKFFVDGKSQVEIADQLEVGQPTIHKTIYGNQDYKKDKIYGGLISKIGKQLNQRNIPYCCHLIEPYGDLFKFVFGI